MNIMKQLVKIILLFVVLNACKKSDDPSPIADPKVVPTASYKIEIDGDGLAKFTNNSTNATNYEWDFGDGKGKSTEKNPSYQYLKPGKYKTTLKALKNGVSASFEQESEVNISQKNIEEIDLLISNILSKFNVPGASLAISKNEKLVYSKSFGLANVTTSEKMTTDHIFRIASCSKPYCGMAIMKLVEQKKLKLSDKVFGEGAILGTKFGTKIYTDQVKSITVSQLLHNSSGFFIEAKGGDSINKNASLNNQQFLNWIMDASIVEFEPGSAYHYNNTNFFVASIIVEQLSGMTYADFLKKEIFDAINDPDGKISVNNKPYPKEVKYHGQGGLVGNEYNFDIERYKGAGANVTSAKGLLKFALAIDGQPNRQELLSSDLWKDYNSFENSNTSWAHGFGLWGTKKYMYGTLPGTQSAWMIEPETGMSVSLIFNGNLDYTRGNEYYNTFVFAMQDILVDLLTKKRSFQNIDQFSWE
jgi:D-alanyl-D-alanine carboxypeptidase